MTDRSRPIERAATQARNVPLDAHLHTELSPDSLVPMELYAAQAFERGIPEIAITDHLDFLPGAPAYEYTDYPTRQRAVRELQERWAGRVKIHFGVELTYESRYDAEIRAYLRDNKYDYVLGTVHGTADGPYGTDNIDAVVEGKSLAEAVAPNFEEVLAAIQTGLFDTIGHLDQVKRWLLPWFSPADFAGAAELYEPLLAALVESGAALEVNSSGLRHPVHETYPAAWAVQRFRDLGGRRVTVGSDAHLPKSFAFGLEEACEILAAAGFEKLSVQRSIDRGDLVLPDRFGRAVGSRR